MFKPVLNNLLHHDIKVSEDKTRISDTKFGGRYLLDGVKFETPDGTIITVRYNSLELVYYISKKEAHDQ